MFQFVCLLHFHRVAYNKHMATSVISVARTDVTELVEECQASWSIPKQIKKLLDLLAR